MENHGKSLYYERFSQLSIATLTRGYKSIHRASSVPILNPLFLQTFQGRRTPWRHGRGSWKESHGSPGHRESLCGRGRGQDRDCGEGGQVHLEALWRHCLLGFLHVYWFQGNESNKIIMRRRIMGIGQAVPSTWLAVQPCSGHGFHIIFSTPGLCLHTHTTNYKYDIKYGMQDWAHPFGLIFHKNTVSEVGLSISLWFPVAVSIVLHLPSRAQPFQSP